MKNLRKYILQLLFETSQLNFRFYQKTARTSLNKKPIWLKLLFTILKIKN